MRIGVMLRSYDRAGGIGIYSRNIIKHLLAIDSRNEYVLMYNNQEHVGKYSNLDNVEEVFLPATNPLLWDQWQVPKVVRGKGVELLFNTKFSLPFMTDVKKIMVLHGASWFVRPDLYTKLDIFYVRRAMPFYCRIADFLISNSDLTTRDFIEILNIPKEKIGTVPLAQGESFHPVEDRETLESVTRKYSLPVRFIVTVTSYDPRKNFDTLFRAFKECRKQNDIHLVVVGKDCHRYQRDFDMDSDGLKDYVHFPGWIEQHDLPAIYSLASAFVFPSVYEEFGIPVVESMACGCPVVSSNTGAIPELTQGAALLADPFDAQAHADNILKLLQSRDIYDSYRQKGLERAKEFSWEKAAAQTLEIFSTIAG